jgi:hypothetical protein
MMKLQSPKSHFHHLLFLQVIFITSSSCGCEHFAHDPFILEPNQRIYTSKCNIQHDKAYLVIKGWSITVLGEGR